MNEIFKKLGYELETDTDYEIIYRKPFIKDIYTIIKIWKSENDTYILKYITNNNECIKMNLDEFEAIHELLIEKGWI